MVRWRVRELLSGSALSLALAVAASCGGQSSQTSGDSGAHAGDGGTAMTGGTGGVATSGGTAGTGGGQPSAECAALSRAYQMTLDVAKQCYPDLGFQCDVLVQSALECG